MQLYSFTSELNYALNTLTSPVGVVAVLIFLVFLVLSLLNPWVKWVAITLIIWISSVAFFIDARQQLPVPLAFPLQSIAAQGRPLTTGLLLLLVPAALFAPRGWRRKLIGAPAILLFIFQLVLSARIWISGVPDRAIVSFFIFVLMFLALSLGFGKWLQTWDDVNKLVRCIVCAGAINAIATLYQLAMNRSVALAGHRLMGVNGNPQGLAIACALALPPALYLLGRAAEPKFWRVFSGIVAGFLIMMVLWSGSRTGILMCLVGVTVIFWSRLGRLLAVGIIAGLVALFAIQFYEQSTLTMTELLTRGDTRTQIWRQMIEAFVANPVAGMMESGYGAGENSYLSVAAQMGLIGVIPLMAFLVATFVGFVKIFRWRAWLGSERQFADVVVAGNLSLLVGAVFEGYLMGTLVPSVICLIIYLALMTFVIDAAKLNWEQSNLLGAEAGIDGGELAYEYATPGDYQSVGSPF